MTDAGVSQPHAARLWYSGNTSGARGAGTLYAAVVEYFNAQGHPTGPGVGPAELFSITSGKYLNCLRAGLVVVTAKVVTEYPADAASHLHKVSLRKNNNATWAQSYGATSGPNTGGSEYYTHSFAVVDRVAVNDYFGIVCEAAYAFMSQAAGNEGTAELGVAYIEFDRTV